MLCPACTVILYKKVSFEIFRDGVSLGHYETNASGEILLTGIEPGTYRAVEVDRKSVV